MLHVYIYSYYLLRVVAICETFVSLIAKICDYPQVTLTRSPLCWLGLASVAADASGERYRYLEIGQ